MEKSYNIITWERGQKKRREPRFKTKGKGKGKTKEQRRKTKEERTQGF